MKMSLRSARPLWFAAASSVLACHAVVVQAQVPPFELQPVTVTGTGTARSLGSEIAATSVLTRGDIERSGAQDAVQVLNMLGTALVEQQGGPGTLAAVRIRGADSRDTLVLIDGVPITDVTTGQPIIQQIPASVIERVEVVRGNMSALYGANATGGVIQIFTRRGAGDKLQAQVDAGVGSRGTRSIGASVAMGGPALSGRVTVGSDRTDGFSASNAPTANPDADGNKRVYATVGVDWQAAPGHRLSLDLRHIDGRAAYDSASSFSDPADIHNEHDVQDGLMLRGVHDLPAEWSLSWRVGQSREHRVDTVVALFGFENDNTLKNNLAAVELAGVLGQGWRVQAGVERLSQSTDSASYTQKERDTDVLRVGSTYDADWGSLQANVRHDKTSDFGSATTALIGGKWKLSKELSVLGSASTSFTPPTLDFLYFDCGGFPCSNPNLKPERARNVEAGLQWQDARTLARATVFSAHYRDKIANDAFFVPQNLARVKNEGLELSLRQSIAAWSVLAEATFQNPKNEETGERPIRRTREQFAVRADYSQANWQAGAGVRYVGDRLDTGGTLPSYTVVDASARMQVNAEWSVSASIENLFDRRYEPTVGYNGRPRGVFVGLSWRPKT